MSDITSVITLLDLIRKYDTAPEQQAKLYEVVQWSMQQAVDTMSEDSEDFTILGIQGGFARIKTYDEAKINKLYNALKQYASPTPAIPVQVIEPAVEPKVQIPVLEVIAPVPMQPAKVLPTPESFAVIVAAATTEAHNTLTRKPKGKKAANESPSPSTSPSPMTSPFDVELQTHFKHKDFSNYATLVDLMVTKNKASGSN